MDVLLILTLISILPKMMASKPELQAVIEGNAKFTQKLYSILAQEPGNVFFSPISAHAVLSMAYQGAEGSTSNAFSASLNVADKKQAAEGYHDVIKHLNNVGQVQLSMANKVYLKQGYSLNLTFKEAVENNFHSEVEAVNFSNNVVTAKQINSWVEDKTKNKIKDLINPDSLDADTRLVLVNAIYFKGNWASKFDPERTKTEKFYLNDNDSIDVQMMNTKGKYFYKDDETLDAKVLELPYADGDVSLVVILPNKRNGIAELEQKLANTDLTKITENMFKPEVTIKLPKFKIETSIELNEPLKKLGLQEIFSRQANFSGMLEQPEPLYVSKVIQKAFIEVNEEGTEAAAATGVKIEMRCLPMIEDFVADHPFLIALLANQDNLDAVLFTGRIATL